MRELAVVQLSMDRLSLAQDKLEQKVHVHKPGKDE